MRVVSLLALALALVPLGCGGSTEAAGAGTSVQDIDASSDASGSAGTNNADTGTDAAADAPGKTDAGASSDASDGASTDKSKPGSPCAESSTCMAGGSGTPVCITDWPDGYCAVADCAKHGHDCPDDPGQGGTATTGSKCVLDPTATCLALCASNTDCREGYSCQPRSDAAGHSDVNVCVPVGGASDSGVSDGTMQGDGTMGGDGGMMGGGGGM